MRIVFGLASPADLLLAGCSAPGANLPPAATPTATVVQAFDLEVLFPPTLVRRADGSRLVYELHLTNFARTSLALSRVQILDAASGAPLQDLDEAALGSALSPVTPGAPARNDRIVEPGQRALLYLESALPTVPSRLRHRITFAPTSGDGAESASVEGGETTVRTRPVPRLGPPLLGGPWVAVYQPEMERGHRRVTYAVRGRARIPGRFAVDWMRPQGAANPALGSEGGQTRGDGLGAEVLAVANAVVAAMPVGRVEAFFPSPNLVVSFPKRPTCRSLHTSSPR